MKKKPTKKKGSKKKAKGAAALLGKPRRIFVYDDNSTLKVYPCVLVVDAGDEVELVNSTNEDVQWQVPKGPFDAATELDETVGKGKPSKEHKTRKVTLAVTYKVTGKKTTRVAVGGSDPVIIIEG